MLPGMFYVANVSGSLVPFDRRTTPIATRTVSTSVSDVPGITGVSAAEASPNVAAAAATATAPDPASVVADAAEDAASYDGPVIFTGAASSFSADALDAARAGSLAAPPVRGASRGEPVAGPPRFDRILAARGAAPISDDTGRSSERVNPIRGAGYRRQQPEKERRRALAAADLMSAPVYSLRADQPLGEALREIRARKFRHLPIVADTGTLVGIISDRDFIGLAATDEVFAQPIRSRMVTNILTARPETELRSIADIMIGHRIGCLPIVDERGVLVGILTRTDILRAIVNRAPIELWT